MRMSSNASSSSTMIPFERYDEEFLSLTEQVTSKLRALDPKAFSSSAISPPSSSPDADVRMAHALLLQADDLLKQMGLEARGVEDASVKRDLLGKVSSFYLPLFRLRVERLACDREKLITQARGEGGGRRRRSFVAARLFSPAGPWL